MAHKQNGTSSNSGELNICLAKCCFRHNHEEIEKYEAFTETSSKQEKLLGAIFFLFGLSSRSFRNALVPFFICFITRLIHTTLKVKFKHPNITSHRPGQCCWCLYLSLTAWIVMLFVFANLIRKTFSTLAQLTTGEANHRNSTKRTFVHFEWNVWYSFRSFFSHFRCSHSRFFVLFRSVAVPFSALSMTGINTNAPKMIERQQEAVGSRTFCRFTMRSRYFIIANVCLCKRKHAKWKRYK